jgi:hypothetical protein
MNCWYLVICLPEQHYSFGLSFLQCIQDRQFTCKIMRCVYVSIVAMEKQHYIFWVCVCSLNYPACKVHGPLCLLWLTLLYHIFPPYLINSMIFRRSYWNKNMCFDFLYKFFKKILIVSRIKHDIVMNGQSSSCKEPIFIIRF